MPTKSTRAEPEAEYVYRDATGKKLCRVTRWPGKRFTQQAWSGAGWVSGVKDVPYTLYRLPEMLASKGTVYFVEGEKDVDTLRARAIVAVCTRGGATRASRTDWTPLKGRDVVVIADADEVGRKFAAEVVTCLRAVGARATGPLECRQGKDATEHIENGGTIHDGLAPFAAAPAPAARPPLRLVPAAPPSEDDVPWASEEPPSADPPDKPEIVMGPDLHRVVSELERHMAELDPGLYQRGRELVTVLGADGERGVADGTPVIRQLSQAAILPRITARVSFVTKKPPTSKAIQIADAKGEQACATKGKIVPPTTHVVQPLLAQGEWPTVRLLRGITEAPALRPDGTILQTAGYDPQTRYLYAPNAEYWPVPDEPTQADARAALETLRELFVHFPFAGGPDSAGSVVAIAALLTMLSRPAIEGPVPAFVFEASVRGAGKTLQCDATHLLATGRAAPHADWPADEDEQRKTLQSLALSAPGVVIFDNIRGVFGGSSLEQAMTNERVTFRALGGNSVVDVPWTSTTLASGNQIQLTDDMTRRVLLSRLEPEEEDPTTRTGLPDLRAIVRGRRPELVRAALTILRSYACHGYPDTGARLVSYESWARIVPGAVRFAGGPDVILARPSSDRGVADDVSSAACLVRSLPALVRQSGHAMTTKALLGMLYPPPEAPDGWDDVRESLEVLSPPKPGGGGRPDALVLGKRLRKYVGRWFGDTQLVAEHDADRHVTRWNVATRTRPVES